MKRTISIHSKTFFLLSLFLVLNLYALLGKAFASGFGIDWIGAKAPSMGGAFAAQADDPSAVYYNPAGIVQLASTQTYLGISIIDPTIRFKSETNNPMLGTSFGQVVDSKESKFYVPYLFMTHKYSDRLSFGLGGFSNFGLGTEWPDNWEGRYITGGTKAELQTNSYNAVIALKPLNYISLSTGFVLQSLDVNFENKILSQPLSDIDFKLTGDSLGTGWNIGLLVWLTDNFKFGASYRSQIRHELDARVELSGVPETTFGGDVRTGAKVDMNLPDILLLGLALNTGPLTLEFGTQWTGWSSYNKLEANFDSMILGRHGTGSIKKNWGDVWTYRFGGNYQLSNKLCLRAGISYEESAIPDETIDPLVPSGDRWLYAAGLGYSVGKLTVDFAYNYLIEEERELGQEAGRYAAIGSLSGKFDDIHAHIIMIGLRYTF